MKNFILCSVLCSVIQVAPIPVRTGLCRGCQGVCRSSRPVPRSCPAVTWEKDTYHVSPSHCRAVRRPVYCQWSIVAGTEQAHSGSEGKIGIWSNIAHAHSTRRPRTEKYKATYHFIRLSDTSLFFKKFHSFWGIHRNRYDSSFASAPISNLRTQRM